MAASLFLDAGRPPGMDGELVTEAAEALASLGAPGGCDSEDAPASAAPDRMKAAEVEAGLHSTRRWLADTGGALKQVDIDALADEVMGGSGNGVPPPILY